MIIAIIGGPRTGKTVFLEKMKEIFSEKGYQIHTNLFVRSEKPAYFIDEAQYETESDEEIKSHKEAGNPVFLGVQSIRLLDDPISHIVDRYAYFPKMCFKFQYKIRELILSTNNFNIINFLLLRKFKPPASYSPVRIYADQESRHNF